MAVKISDLNGIQKAAILLITLGPEKASNVFKHLKEDEIEEDEEPDWDDYVTFVKSNDDYMEKITAAYNEYIDDMRSEYTEKAEEIMKQFENEMEEIL